MKLIAQDNTRVTYLFAIEEIGPLGGLALNLAEMLSGRYRFAIVPATNVSSEELSKGARFERGVFSYEGTLSAINEFIIYSDGLVVGCATTDVGEAFLEDLLGWATSELMFRPFSRQPRKIYLSQLIVEFDRPLGRLLGGYDRIAETLKSHLPETYRQLPQMEFSGINFDWDRQSTNPLIVAAKFTIERRMAIGFERERYFCGAPMRTNDHLAALREIEGFLES